MLCCAAPAAGKPPGQPKPSPAATTHVVPSEDEKLPVAEVVAKFHRNAFEPTAAEAKLGRVICLVTLHDAALQRGGFFPLVLFAGGSIGTWRQTPAGSEQPFLAKLGPEEQARASELVETIPTERALSRERFDASTLVMGVSMRVNGRVETLYFDHERVPAALSQLVAMLKQRLEASHRGP
jgi:hypothetical protein